MKHILVLIFITASLAAFGQETPRQATPTYVIVAHTGYDYTVRHGRSR
jgi:hypothetical protein